MSRGATTALGATLLVIALGFAAIAMWTTGLEGARAMVGGMWTMAAFSAVGALACLLPGSRPVALRLLGGTVFFVCPGYVVAMLAILKAGGMIVPLDPAMPDERVAEILRQTSAQIVVDEVLFTASTKTLAAPADYRAATVPPGHAAYAVFTSGTTGAPKGVIGTHRALSAYFDDHIERVLRPAAGRIGRPLRVAHAWSFTFDAAWQPLAALLEVVLVAP